jgi:hypothetical protein
MISGSAGRLINLRSPIAAFRAVRIYMLKSTHSEVRG